MPDTTGFFLSHAINDAFIAVNRIFKDGVSIHWLRESVNSNGKTCPVGTMYIPAGANTFSRLERLTAELGLDFDATTTGTTADAFELNEMRVGLWGRYGGLEPSGWTRFILENFEFSSEVVYPPLLDLGNLDSRFDVLIFVDDGIPPSDRDDPSSIRVRDVPTQYESQLGNVTLTRTVPRLREVLEGGGTISYHRKSDGSCPTPWPACVRRAP